MTSEFRRDQPMSDELLAAVAERFGTPTYVYDLDAVRRRAELLQRELGGAELLYALKANPCGPVVRALGEKGLGAEVITIGELERAHRAGIPGDKVLVGGPGQDATLVARSLELGIGRVSLDSVWQWGIWRQARPPTTRFLVRINPQLDPQTHPHLATGTARSKFGMPLAEALDLAAELAEAGCFAGFHFHVGSQIRSLAVYRSLAETVAMAMARRPEADTLDLGGGFAVPDFPLRQFAALTSELANAHSVRLLFEPGRFLVAGAGVLLSRVRQVKKGVVRHVIADAGMAELLRPALYGAEHPVRRLGEDCGGEPADLDGPLCENADMLAQNVLLPADVAPGDLLVVGEAGAYGMSMASNYASSLRPAEVVIDGKEIALARARERTDDLYRLESG